jgi:hypothetical protein
MSTTEQTVQHTPGEWANARLIAAAPDLLAACKAIVNARDVDLIGEAPWDTLFQQARAAIAKAEGGAA